MSRSGRSSRATTFERPIASSTGSRRNAGFSRAILVWGGFRPEIAHDALAWVVGRYLILYRALDGGVEIVRIVHGGRSVEQIEF